MKTITIILDKDGTDVPTEDLFKGNFQAHKVPDLEDTWVITKAEQ